MGLGRFGFVAVAVAFHLAYIFSIFDIYFVSPIVHGMTAFSVDAPPPAQRLVLIVGDGLRADKAFQSFPDPSPSRPDHPSARTPRPLMPFLRSRVERHGTFGVSHTRVPTESRPGHVALIAGLYEDVSAVTTGWKLNPVTFDSVFNRSRHTWSWGSPDILPMFKEGAVPGRVDAECYAEEAEDYTADAVQLDEWVFERVEEFFTRALSNATLDVQLRQGRLVFFLHLLGLDTTGHSYRPYSQEYLHNIKVVDAGLERISRLIEDFYGDDRTAFVFTADHGMSDWGSHGDGHPDNTRTPLVAWGSGVRRPVVARRGRAPGHEDGFSADWGLDHVARRDVNQADVAALMAYLVGLPFPVNSVGELPLEYVAARPAERAQAMYVNARGVLEMYRVKEAQKRASELRFKPYSAFEEAPIAIRIAAIESLIEQGRHEPAIFASRELLHLGLEGLRYLQTYDWLFLRMMITLGYLGWMAFAMTTVVDLHVLHGTTTVSRTPMLQAATGAVTAGLFAFLLVRSSPFTYYVYCIFPIVFWEEVVARKEALWKGKRQLLGNVGANELLSFAARSCAFVGLLEALVASYFYREVYSIIYAVAIFWPLLYGRRFVRANKGLIAHWAVGCFLMSLFTFLPVIKVESLNTILLGGFLMFGAGTAFLLFDDRLGNAPKAQPTLLSPRALLGAQVGLILLAMIVTRSSVASLQAKRGLPLGNQIVGWLVLVISFTMPFLHGLFPNRHYLHRLLVIFLTFSPTLVLLTISYEGLFYFAFCATLIAWVRMEHRIYTFGKSDDVSPPSPRLKPKPLAKAVNDVVAGLAAPEEHPYRALTLGDARIALFFFFFLQSAFFSTGNIASISSFSLDSVYRLIPVFNPFSQGALLLLKLLIPFAVISAHLGVLNQRLGVAPSALFMLVMAVSDVLTLNFFWLVRDEGSWLEIGTSISHFGIASLLCAFVAMLELFSGVSVGGVELEVQRPSCAASNGSAINEGKYINGKVTGSQGASGTIG